MSVDRWNKAREYEEQATAAVHRGDWLEAERYFLLASQEIATSKNSIDVKNRTNWDRAAKRARRLAQLGGAE